MTEQQSPRDRYRKLPQTLLAVIATLLVLSGGVVSAAGRCVTVDVPAPFVMPNGDLHPAGSLKLCDSRTLSPVSGLHKVYVDGHLINMVESRTGRSEGPAESQPFVQFRRNGHQQLELLGYAWPDGKKMKTYVMVRDDSRRAKVGSAPSVAKIEPNRESRSKEEQIILVATRGN